MPDSYHRLIVAGCCAVQWRPAIRVHSVNVYAELNQTSNNVKVAGTDGVVKGGDTLIVGGTRIWDLKQEKNKNH